MMELVEREPALQTLRLRLQSTSLCGHIVLVAGEAGVGKTSMLRALAATHGTVWWGACDALQTPHPLAPLLARDAQNPQPPVLFNHPFHLVRSRIATGCRPSTNSTCGSGSTTGATSSTTGTRRCTATEPSQIAHQNQIARIVDIDRSAAIAQRHESDPGAAG